MGAFAIQDFCFLDVGEFNAACWHGPISALPKHGTAFDLLRGLVTNQATRISHGEPNPGEGVGIRWLLRSCPQIASWLGQASCRTPASWRACPWRLCIQVFEGLEGWAGVF